MIWLWLIIAGLGLIIMLKIILKTFKIAFVLMIIAVLAALAWIWQHGHHFKL
jgi:hypothetical protein